MYENLLKFDELTGNVYLYDLNLLKQFINLQNKELQLIISKHLVDSYKTLNQTNLIFSLPNKKNCFPKFSKIIYEWNITEDATIGKTFK